MADPFEWEYRVITSGTNWAVSKDEELEAVLNQLGEECWEVVAMYPVPGGMKVRVVAKKPLTARTRRLRSMPGLDQP
jgi:hypothetical protein